MQAYSHDLAHVHDVGYGYFAREAAPGLLGLLRRAGVREGLVVDLGCGSGIWAAALLDAGYDVLGIDQSEAMLEIARRRAPGARFERGSLFDAPLPPCAAVTTIGECVSYTFDPRAGRPALQALIRRIAAALQPGGLFVFDVVTAGIEPAGGRHTWSEGSDWLLCLDAREEPAEGTMTRTIALFRPVAGDHDAGRGEDATGPCYRRSDETHRLWLYSRADARADLEAAGLQPRTLAGYGRELRFRRGHIGFAAHKRG